MPRKPSIWPRKGTPWWYTTIDGKQHRLSRDKAEAQKLFHKLMAERAETLEAKPEPPAAHGISFRKLADEYLKATKDDKVDRAFEQQVTCLKDFCAHLKRKIPARELRPPLVRAWLETKPTWGRSTKTIKRKTIKAVLNWGVREGYLVENPLKKMAGGESERRDRVMTPEELKAIYAFLDKRSPEFGDFLRAVELTGARPFSEMAQVTAADVDFEGGTITLQKHKNRRKTGKPRTIFVVPELLGMLRARAGRHPGGPLFRSRRGKPWYNGSSCKWFAEIAKGLGIEGAFAYALRHTYITNALIRNVPVEVVAALVGNTPAVIHRHYSHVGKDQKAMKAAALQAVGLGLT